MAGSIARERLAHMPPRPPLSRPARAGAGTLLPPPPLYLRRNLARPLLPLTRTSYQSPKARARAEPATQNKNTER
jgi:hypothetical protein